ncbi:hypothetical protein LEP1GSC021_3145 [Leptospira noguchii str. 1993005606]|uniref:Uncharacterized protein n=2 Tax=Leptospira noguchii TaxID=28182 RepID=M6YT58_9LEPT|nr:hypothetical protein LEP1GSC035_4931 [Leptospira noguchii str. 2007001578]EMO89523.1 hypothetical protein LEP1GSC024_1573 [Leptospira noguchii str. 2001034031]EPE85930.1 hypothetical protein LEP1GSC021_3145 [Leptospira noguchii str. 1993005606]
MKNGIPSNNASQNLITLYQKDQAARTRPSFKTSSKIFLKSIILT